MDRLGVRDRQRQSAAAALVRDRERVERVAHGAVADRVDLRADAASQQQRRDGRQLRSSSGTESGPRSLPGTHLGLSSVPTLTKYGSRKLAVSRRRLQHAVLRQLADVADAQARSGDDRPRLPSAPHREDRRDRLARVGRGGVAADAGGERDARGQLAALAQRLEGGRRRIIGELVHEAGDALSAEGVQRGLSPSRGSRPRSAAGRAARPGRRRRPRGCRSARRRRRGRSRRRPGSASAPSRRRAGAPSSWRAPSGPSEDCTTIGAARSERVERRARRVGAGRLHRPARYQPLTVSQPLGSLSLVRSRQAWIRCWNGGDRQRRVVQVAGVDRGAAAERVRVAVVQARHHHLAAQVHDLRARADRTPARPCRCRRRRSSPSRTASACRTLSRASTVRT